MKLFFDRLLLPVGAILSGLIAAGSIVSAYVRSLRELIHMIFPYKAIIGAVSLMAGVMAFLFPYQGPPLLGSLFPALFGASAGLLLLLENLTDQKILERKKMIQLGNILIWFKYPLGLLALFSGILHLLIPDTPLF